MDRALSVRAALALGLALLAPCAAAQEAAPDDAGRAGSVQVFQRSRAGLEFVPPLRADEPGSTNLALRDLARGTLWRASLGEDTSLTLRLRGRTLSLVWAMPLSR